MDIAAAFKIIREDETKCLKRIDSDLHYCFVKGVFSAFMVHGKGEAHKPFPYAYMKGQESFSMEWIFAEFEVKSISEL